MHPVLSACGIAYLEVPELSAEDDDSQAIHKAKHHRMRHHSYEFAEPKEPERYLQNPSEYDGREQILDPMRADQSHHHNSHGSCRTGDHPWPTAKGGGYQAQDEGRIHAHQRIHMSHHGKSESLGHKG